MTDTTLTQRIKDLTARFGKGWHDGIQIDASDIADLCLAAGALEQQAAQIEALRADAERLRALATCGCGDGFTAHDPGTCGNCMAAIDVALRQEQPT